MKPLKEGLDLRPPLSSEIQRSRDFLSFAVLEEGNSHVLTAHGKEQPCYKRKERDSVNNLKESGR